MLNSILNGFYLKTIKSSYDRFVEYRNPVHIQLEILMETIEKNKDSLYGRRHDFHKIKSLEEFRKAVPVSTYEDYEEYIELIKKGEEGVLTAERVILLEPTSGSSSKKKLIPYTDSLKKQFQRGIEPWLYDLYKNYPLLKSGKSYWSISPANSKEYTEGGIPIGFEEDGAYLGRVFNLLTKFIFAVPPEVKFEKDMEEFYLKTANHLLKAGDLGLISVWHPSFLLLLLDFMKENIEKLDIDLSQRRWILEGEYSKIWPQLEVISCWTSGNSRDYAGRISDRFGNVTIQGKGLLSTEAFTTFPLTEAKASVLSVESHFFEFVSLKDGKIHMLDTLEEGGQYEVIVTTGGGFYRYNTKDIVEVKCYYKGLPCMDFVGKNDLVSDRFGEKLNELFLREMFREMGIDGEFNLVAFEGDSYVLYTSSLADGTEVEGRLRENYHYNYARQLGQLKGLRIFRLSGTPHEEYISYCLDRGQKLGDIKINKLVKTSGLDKYFKGDYI